MQGGGFTGEREPCGRVDCLPGAKIDVRVPGRGLPGRVEHPGTANMGRGQPPETRQVADHRPRVAVEPDLGEVAGGDLTCHDRRAILTESSNQERGPAGYRTIKSDFSFLKHHNHHLPVTLRPLLAGNNR